MKISQILQINEAKTVDDLDELFVSIKRDCGEFLKITDEDTPLYRGISLADGTIDFSKKRQHRIDRRPLDSKKSFTTFFNVMCEVSTGITNIRGRSVYASQRGFAVSDYGVPTYMFPAGNIKVLWSPEIRDSTLSFQKFVANLAENLNEVFKEDGFDFSKFSLGEFFSLFDDISTEQDPGSLFKPGPAGAKKLYDIVARRDTDLKELVHGKTSDVEWQRGLIKAFKLTFERFYKVGGPELLKQALSADKPAEIAIIESDGYYILPLDRYYGRFLERIRDS